MFDSILVVCMGNICRSPIGEQLLKRSLPDKKIISAGLGALVGNSADPTAILVAEENGIDLGGHIAKQLENRMCREADLILVMERKHIDIISKMVPEVRGKTMLFGHWLNQIEINDPYQKGKESFEHVFRLLNEASHLWVLALQH